MKLEKCGLVEEGYWLRAAITTKTTKAKKEIIEKSKYFNEEKNFGTTLNFW